MSIGLRTLILNADMMPVNLITLKANTVEESIVRILNGTCYMIEAYDRVFRTPGSKHHILMPSVMARTKYFKRPEILPLYNEYLLLRDGYKCVYCGIMLTDKTMTWDHYIPESKGGNTSWENILSACNSCNHNYGDTPAHKKNPSHKPYLPTYSKMISLRRRRPIVLNHWTWEPWIGNWLSDIIILDNKRY